VGILTVIEVTAIMPTNESGVVQILHVLERHLLSQDADLAAIQLAGPPGFVRSAQVSMDDHLSPDQTDPSNPDCLNNLDAANQACGNNYANDVANCLATPWQPGGAILTGAVGGGAVAVTIKPTPASAVVGAVIGGVAGAIASLIDHNAAANSCLQQAKNDFHNCMNNNIVAYQQCINAWAGPK
jgi:hypothetical protein